MQEPTTMTATSRRGQVVEILATGILRVLASRALERDSRVEGERRSGRPQLSAMPGRPTAVLAGR